MPLERKNRLILVHGISLAEGKSVRVFLKEVTAGGIMASTPTAAFRMCVSLSSAELPTVRLAYPGSEFVIKEPVVLQDNLLCGGTESGILLKLTDQGDLIWIAGFGGWASADGKNIHTTHIAATPTDCLRLLVSSQDLDREEGAFTASTFGNASQSEKEKLLQALETALTDNSEDVRRCAAESLAKIGDSSAVSSLTRCAESDSSGWVRKIAQESLRKLAPEVKLHPTALNDEDKGIKITGTIGGSVDLGGTTVGYDLDPDTCRGTQWFPRLFASGQ